VSLSLILRPTLSRPVCLGIKHPSRALVQNFITVRRLRVCWCGALSLTRGRVCRLHLFLALASAVILGSESHGTRLRFETSLLVASYDSQGYGGSIRPRLHTGYRSEKLFLSFRECRMNVSWPNRSHIKHKIKICFLIKSLYFYLKSWKYCQETSDHRIKCLIYIISKE
jgi:hypothetical protein